MENSIQLTSADEKTVDISKKYLEIASKKNRGVICYTYEKINSHINENLKDIVKNFLKVGKLLSLVKYNNLFVIQDYKNIYEYALDQYSLSKTTVKNLINIFNRFCESVDMIPDENRYYLNSINLKKEFEEYNYSQLVELLPLSDEEIKNYSPSLTVKEIRNNKLKNEILNSFNDNENLKEKTILKMSIEKIIAFFHERKMDLSNYEVKKSVSRYNDDMISIDVIFKYKNRDFMKYSYELNNYEFDAKIQSLLNELYCYDLYSFDSNKSYDNFLESTLIKFYNNYSSLTINNEKSKTMKKPDTKKYDGFMERNGYWMSSACYVKKIEEESPGTVDKNNLIFTTNSGSKTIIKSKNSNLVLTIDRDNIVLKQEDHIISELSFYELIKADLKEYLLKLNGPTSDQVKLNENN